MKAIRELETIQIEVTNACHRQCSNCTRLVGHHPKPYFMDLEFFDRALESTEGAPNLIGIMGGEPLLHPQFDEICRRLHAKYPPEKCGLWSSFPPGKEHHAEVICQTFGNLFLNDHSRDDILHCPILVPSDEVMEDKDELWFRVNSCWINQWWSCSINPNGAYFCEIAAALGMLFDVKGWPIKKGWWKKAPIDYEPMMRTFCLKCGCAMPLLRRPSTDGIDDISPKMYQWLKDYSPKIKAGKYQIHDLKLKEETRQCASYKDIDYRRKIAERYDMIVVLNERGYMTPHLAEIKRRRKREAAEKTMEV
jgi:hypothetical protein